MKICIYCASSATVDKSYFDATERLAKEMLKEDVEIVFGGGAVGLMGKLADIFIAGGGKIKGIMPNFMNEVEWAHKGISDFEFTETMHERKAKFLEGIDGVVALPGGTGTFEELLEAITLKRLGQFTKPIVILNTNGYYDPLRQMLEKSIRENFMHPRHLEMWAFVDDPEGVIPALRNAAAWDKDAINFAVNRGLMPSSHTQDYMNTKEAYAHWSATYDADRNLTRDLDQIVTKASLADLRCKSILEIGCGTGKNTSLLAQIGEKVCALDFSESMIHQAKAKLRSDHVHFVVADITRPWPYEERSFDLIVCNLVLEHIQDLTFIFSEASRVLADAGRFFICELHPFRQYQGTQARFQRGAETVLILAFVHHISDFTETAARNGLSLHNLREWWHEEDERAKLPRLVSFIFEKRGRSRRF